MLSCVHDFPQLSKGGRISKQIGTHFCYFDSAATMMPCNDSLDAYMDFQNNCASSPGRGAYRLSRIAEDCLEASREQIRAFYRAENYEMIFVRNATEGLNLAARILANRLSPGDVIIGTDFEHHSNSLPWRRIADETDALYYSIGIDDQGNLDYEALLNLEMCPIAIIAVTALANTTGYQPDLQKIGAFAKRNTAMVVVDAAQASAHSEFDAGQLNPDMFAVSGHKAACPKGIGALFLKPEFIGERGLLVGGGTVLGVDSDIVKYKSGVGQYEAGTQDAGLACAWAAACRYLSKIGISNIISHEVELYEELRLGLSDLPMYKIQPQGNRHSKSILSFTIERGHSHDLAAYLDQRGICIRTGNLCAQPYMISTSTLSLNRASFALYNTIEEVEYLLQSLRGFSSTSFNRESRK